jgi:lipoprotein NlpI
MEGRFKESIAAFDKVIELEPRMEPRHWQRGITYYYAGEYQKGVDQFELHQTVNSQDVENAVWHFICKTRLDGVEAARKALIPIQHDGRVPMEEVWNLFAGKGTVEDVLEAANRSSPYKRQQLCYAHLYLGLYYEALEKTELAKHHILLAANEYSMDNYMGMVAQVHAEVLRKSP